MIHACVAVAVLAWAGEPAKENGTSPTESKAKMVSFSLHPVEEAVIEKTNAERARHGLAPLVLDTRLMSSARSHCAWMTNSRRLQHTSRPVAENIAMGQSSAREALGSWMSSSGHRANILNRGYRRIGVAAYRAPNGTCYWCQQFTR